MICNNCNKKLICIDGRLICKTCDYRIRIINENIETLYFRQYPIELYSFNFANSTPYSSIYLADKLIDFNHHIVPNIKDNTIMFKEFIIKINNILILQ